MQKLEERNALEDVEQMIDQTVAPKVNEMFMELFVCWVLNVPATCKCISGTDLLRQFYVLPH